MNLRTVKTFRGTEFERKHFIMFPKTFMFSRPGDESEAYISARMSAWAYTKISLTLWQKSTNDTLKEFAEHNILPALYEVYGIRDVNANKPIGGKCLFDGLLHSNITPDDMLSDVFQYSIRLVTTK